jgi:hypothetical protein
MIELKIYQYNVSGAVVSAFDVDLYDNVPMPVNKSIVDIKEPEQRKSDYSLSIRIPATAKNRSIFSDIDNLNRATINTSSTNFTPDFNANLKAEAIILNNGVEQMRGYLQLTEVPINDRDIEYEIIIIGKLANLFQDLGESLLTDLDLSQFDHPWTTFWISNSWATDIRKNGNAYTNFDVSGNPKGEGYVYPLIDNGSSTGNQEIEYTLEKAMYPAIYVKQLVDSIFASQGYRYQSDFFNSIEFKRLVVPFTSGKFIMTEQEVDDRTWEVTNSADVTYTDSGGTIPVISDVKVFNFNTITKDTVPSGADTTNDWVQIASGNNGKYRVGLQGDITIRNVSGGAFTQQVGLVINVIRVRSGVRTIVDGSTTIYSFSATPNGTGITKSINFGSKEFDTLSGDRIYMEFAWYCFNQAANNLEVDIESGFGFFSSPSSTYNEGQTISINAALPQEVKQADFLSYLFKMFNLYIVPDKIDPKKLIIEPRDTFYTNDVVDLTNYLDTSRELLIKPMGVLDFRKLEMLYKSDNDEYNKKYQDLFREPYSTKLVQVNNDFLTQTKKVEVGFSATPLANASTHDRIYSKIRMEDPPKQDADLPSFNIRILYYGGLVATSTGWTLKDNAGLNNYVDFPYAGMLDSLANPQLDLGWAMPKAINYGLGNTTYTNGNLYNRFWRKTIEEITDKDSKLVGGYFHLTENQFANLDFRKFYQIDKQFYRLYTIENDLTNNEPCRLEFLKLKVAPPFILQSGSGNGGGGAVIDNEDMPMFTTKDNGLIFTDEKRKQTTVQGLSGTDSYFLNFSEEVSFYESGDDIILPDAEQELLGGVQPIIRIKNINGGSVKLYPIKVGQTINSSNSFTLQNHHTVELMAYKGKWQVMVIVNTGGS